MSNRKLIELANGNVRTRAKEKGVRHWEIASAMGIGEATLTRKLRFTLSEEDEKHIIGIIDRLSKVGEKS